jgi:hypothetical protein
MQFGDITQTIHDAWSFIWPPFVMIIIAFLCSKVLSSSGTDDALVAGWEKVKMAATHFESIRKVLGVYGLSKLIPFISLVAVISILYLLQGPITILCSKLPPNFSYQPNIIVERSDKDDLLLLLRKYPTANSIGEAYSFAQEVLRSDENFEKTKYDRVQIHYKIQNFIKFGIACLIILFFLHLFHGASLFPLLLRLIVGFVLISIIWLIVLVPFLFNQEQSFYDDWRRIQISLQAEAGNLLKAPPSTRSRGKFDRSFCLRNLVKIHYKTVNYCNCLK